MSLNSLIMIEDDSSDEMTVDSNARDPTEADTEHINEELANEKSPEEVVLLDEGSCETVAIDTLETINVTEDKPLLELMKHLINYNGKQNTTLTNAQLIGILKDEFEIDITNLHFLTVDIYMNVLKKFLKDWPQWDEFDRVMHESRCMNDSEEIEKMLESEYQSLKEYLASMLKTCKPFAQQATQSAKRMTGIPAPTRSGPDDVILEVNCTRNQLNSLFFRKPHPDLNSTIFNIVPSVPSKINLQNLNFKSILNWAHINVTVNMKCFKYKRELVHNYKHVLVNKKLNHQEEAIRLNHHLQISKNTKPGETVTKKDVNMVIHKILSSIRYSYEQQLNVEALFQTIKQDVDIIGDKFNIVSTFRHYMSPYPYVRYLYEDVDTESEKYDLQLRETVSPRLKFSITRLLTKMSAFDNEVDWLRLECTFCNLSFIGVEGIEYLKIHFRDVHLNDPDWMCMNCEETFTAMGLASWRWYHKCSTRCLSE